MQKTVVHVLLADDDEDDRQAFQDAFLETKMDTLVTTVNDGRQLMDYLYDKSRSLPDIVFLDLNMPAKNGVECLKEIRSDARFKDMTIAIYSTSLSDQDVEDTFVAGANVYIRKPNNYSSLKNILEIVMNINWQYHMSGLNKETFLLSI